MTRRILLAVTGLTPQIVTETLYGLITAPEPHRFVPDELHIITTQPGKRLVQALFEGTQLNQLDALCEQYGIQNPKLQAHTIGGRNNPLDDVRTAADNEAAADSILEVVRKLTGPNDTAVHFSIAGGRKTMGYYLGTCASLLARPQDRMSHVLVNEPFESAPDFFFPPKPPTYMLIRGRPTDTARAEVALANVSFVRLRPLLPAPLVDRGSFTRLVRVVDSILGAPQLLLRLHRTAPGGQPGRCEVEIGGGLRFSLQPKSFAMYWLLAKQAMRPDPWVRATLPAETIKTDFLEIYKSLAGMGRSDEEANKFLTTPDTFLRSEYQNAMSRLSANLKKELGDVAAKVYGPQKEGSGEKLRHKLDLPKDSIQFELLP